VTQLALGVSSRRRLARRTLAALAITITICLALLVPGQSVWAQETPESGVEATEAATEAPVEATEPPTEVVVTEAPVETEAPVSTAAPTEVVATEVPTEAETPTATSTETPTEPPTPTPAPSLDYTLASAPDCQLAPESAATLASGATIEYLCTERMSISGANLAPASMGLTWNVRIDAEGGWSVQVLAPVNPGEVEQWSDPGMASATVAFSPIAPFGSDTTPTTIDTQAEMTYRVRITRPEGMTCDTTPYALTFTRDATPTAAETTATPGAMPDPYRLTPDLATIPVPTVSFAGPLDLGDVSSSADGASPAVAEGTLTVTVDGLDATCGGWTLHLSGAGLVDTDGAPLDGSTLVITAIDDVPLATGECQLAGGCDLLILDGGAGAPTTSTHTIRVELRMPDAPRTGSFRAAVQAALREIVE
jgi:hypothetical protein